MTPALEVSSISGGYGAVTVVRDISFTIAPGTIYGLIGKNGMGKSTLLKLVMGMLPRTVKNISVDGAAIADADPTKMVKRSVSYVQQSRALFQDLNVVENLRLGSLGLSPSVFRSRVEHYIDAFPFLKERMAQKAGTLSGGEQKMLLLVRALLPSPKVLLLDEITEGVQPSIVAMIGDVLRDQATLHGTGVLLVEQNIDFAFKIADSISVLNKGVLTDLGKPTFPDARSEAEKYMSL